MTIVPLPFEVVSIAVLVLILAVDVFLGYRRPHVPSTRESTLWVVFYVVLALIFAGLLLVIDGPTHATEFVAGWLTEYSLSIDNLFVFIVIMTGFAVPKVRQQEVLMVGIILALVFRGIFILIGAQLIENFSWIFYLFGAFLVYTAITQAFGSEHGDATDTRLIRFAKRHLSLTDRYDGGKIRTTIDGKRYFTPILIVLISLGATDLLFALDSIPAIFGITDSPFIVFTANVFALMGLRQLFFLLGDLVERLKYLKYGIAFILAFIGVKLVLHALHENELPFVNGGEHVPVPEIGTGLSLIVIVVSMAVATVASLVSIKRDPDQSLSDLKKHDA
ncbi:TerC family protein [Amnibacterium kyonggiense]|uniref:Tellurite resistance protein TerC n=1 Tax=Amnibacterium kyonggiense TaxID=595671 RepID=A0A4R7FSJ5_9MICO|nr:TerC family protein [Amnibacterium kyonggiense]TDS80837.1 tellurite resistance protein TerC [Amnibacterium kyonggiense]